MIAAPVNDLAARKEFAPDLAEWFFENWIDHRRFYATWWAKENRGFCKKAELKKKNIVDHLTVDNPEALVGTYFIDSDGMVKHVGLDIDAHLKDGDTDESFAKKVELARKGARNVANMLSQVKGLGFVTMASKGGNGYHVRVSFPNRLPAYVARNFGLEIIKGAGLPKNTEIFPKQEKGEFGSQMWLPGSLHFFKKKNGQASTLVDPFTLEPIPFGEWLDYLRSVPAVSEKTLRDLCASSGVDLWKKRERPRPTFNPDAFVAEGVPRFETVDQLVGFLSQHGIEVQKEKGAFGEWTDRLILMQCANSNAHGSQRSDGAAILFNASTGRVGYKCWHNGCARFGWPSVLRNLGYSFKRKPSCSDGCDHDHDHHDAPPLSDDDAPPLSDDDAPSYEAPQPEPPTQEDPGPEEKRPRKREGFTNGEKFYVWQYGEDYEQYEDDMRDGKKVALALGRCLTVQLDSNCPDGCYRKKVCRCSNRNCPGCGWYAWNSVYRPFVETKWKLSHYYTFGIQANGPDAAKAEREHVMNLFRRNPDAKPRWVIGMTEVRFFFEPEMAMVAREKKLPEGRLVTKAEAIELFKETWNSESNFVLQRVREIGFPKTIKENPWMAKSGRHRSGAGARMRVLMAWTTVAEQAKLENARWKEEHPGQSRNECDAHKKLYTHTVTHLPTNIACGSRRGVLREETMWRMVEPAEREWFRHVADLKFSSD